VFITLIGGLFLKDSPLNCIEMLWVNLIMDSLASLALASENPTNDLLKRKPYKRNDSLLTKAMITNIITQALFQIGILIVILNYGDVMFNVTSDRELEHFVWNENNGYHFTLFFDVFVFLQVFNSINARKLRSDEVNVFKGIMNNAYYISVQLFIIVGQIAIVTFGGRAVRVKRLSIVQHCQCIIIASMSLVFGIIVRSICNCMNERKVKVNNISNDKKRN
jgi:magnesium-transporting ATPase (P-type)